MTASIDVPRWSNAPLLERMTDGRMRVSGHGPARTIVPLCASTVRMDSRPDPDQYRRLPFRREDAVCFLTDPDGQFVETLADGSFRLQTWHLCLNNALSVERLMALVAQVMGAGADGVVIRYRNPPQECRAEGRHIGFVRRYDSVASEVPWMPTYDQRVLDLETHRHIRPGCSQLAAFERFAAKAYRLVKRHGGDKAMTTRTASRPTATSRSGCRPCPAASSSTGGAGGREYAFDSTRLAACLVPRRRRGVGNVAGPLQRPQAPCGARSAARPVCPRRAAQT